MPSAADLASRLVREAYPRSNGYDAEWVVANHMGPNALWLMEALTGVLPIERGMKVLDLGCGKAITSIFLAREFGARVWATDLWIDATQNLSRIREAGVVDLVTPVHAEAHDLPYADGFFDAIVSVDAYHYFGTADLYLGYITRFLAPGGRMGIVVPGVTDEIGEKVPEHLAPYWEWEFCSFHSPEWWRTHWTKTQKLSVDLADMVPNGWRDWLDWERLERPAAGPANKEAEMLEADQGRLLGFTRVVGTKPGNASAAA